MKSRRRAAQLLIILSGVALLACPLTTQAQTADLERGAYLATIAGCQYCHSPIDGPAFSGSQIDYEETVLHTPNLTPHETGLAGWTDQQVRLAITTGMAPAGRQLHPVMPYLYYNNMAPDDVTAIVDFLRSLEPVEREWQPNDLGGIELPDPPPAPSGSAAPDRSDIVAYGEYLTTAVLACGACHTPPPGGSEPEPEVYLYLAGGRAFEGEWGVVYAGNLTPDVITGLGAWRDEDIILAVMTGVRPEGRKMLVMPWQAYSTLTSGDMQSVVAYLRQVPAIDNPVPLDELNEGYADYATDNVPAQASPLMTGLAVVTMILLIGLGVLMTVRQYRHAREIRDMDWRRDLLPARPQQDELVDEMEQDVSPLSKP